MALLTDLYELTMACGYWKAGIHQRRAAFHLLFRENPFGGGFTLACGLETAVEYLQRFRFDQADLAYLGTVEGGDGRPIFAPEFLDFLRELRFTCDVDAVPEGTVVFPHEPLVRVTGPLIEAQIVETALLNLVNFQTLIATKAARVVMAARGEPVLEFGLRRAQGIDGGVSASRAAYVGGCAGTSNVLAGRLWGIPVKGTHAHSWVMCFDDEPEAFEAYARAMPNNCVFLVDTYDTLQGVRNAVDVGRRLRQKGHEMVGIRLDSGDLAQLSIEARKILDQAGFPNAAIVASNDLDEHLITSLKEQGATIGVWGVGTRLATGYDQPALGGVYKLSAVSSGDGVWRDKVKVSEQTAKTSTPGILQVRRYREGEQAIGDVIFDLEHPIRDGCTMVDPVDPTRRETFSEDTHFTDLLTPVLRQGKLVVDLPPLEEVRDRAQRQLAEFHAGVKRFVNPHRYPVGLEMGLHQRKTHIILKERGPER
ncbi:MAG: nicotinate phosphoribosyltransferase [Planctomycetes bacterium]|nr:nicotinate phosphoribosyltransferase [Planctomycetota bacterium]